MRRVEVSGKMLVSARLLAKWSTLDMWLAGHATNGEVKPCASTTFNSEWKEWLANACKNRAAEKLSGAERECLWAGNKCEGAEGAI